MCYLEAKEVAISNRACFALVKGFQIGHTDDVDKGDHFPQVLIGGPKDIYNQLSNKLIREESSDLQIYNRCCCIVWATEHNSPRTQKKY